jgi:hypothetical protein
VADCRFVRSLCRNGRKVFGDLAADHPGRIASIGAIEFDRETALIDTIVVLVGDVNHVEPERRHAGVMMLLKVDGHGFFQVILYFHGGQLSLTTRGQQEKDG